MGDKNKILWSEMPKQNNKMDTPLINIHAKKFDQVWDHFQNGFFPNPYDPKQVAGFEGRKTSLAINIPIRHPEIIDQIQRLSSFLGDFDDLCFMPKEYYHITVKWIGFLVDRKEQEYDITTEILGSIIKQTEDIILRISPFKISLKRINGLGSFVICEVDDNGIISNLQGRFHQDAIQIPTYSLEGEGWLPHLSLAGIKSQKIIGKLQENLQRFRDVELGTVMINEFHLTKATLQEPYPICTPIHTFRI